MVKIISGMQAWLSFSLIIQRRHRGTKIAFTGKFTAAASAAKHNLAFTKTSFLLAFQGYPAYNAKEGKALDLGACFDKQHQRVCLAALQAAPCTGRRVFCRLVSSC